jgi:hypothetical protein
MLCLHLNILSSSFYRDDTPSGAGKNGKKKPFHANLEAARKDLEDAHAKLKQISIKYDNQIVFFNLSRRLVSFLRALKAEFIVDNKQQQELVVRTFTYDDVRQLRPRPLVSRFTSSF